MSTKFCKNCRWFYFNAMFNTGPYCNRVELNTPNVVWGPQPSDPKTNRGRVESCGPDAKYFEQRNEPQVVKPWWRNWWMTGK